MRSSLSCYAIGCDPPAPGFPAIPTAITTLVLCLKTQVLYGCHPTSPGWSPEQTGGVLDIQTS
jgi:hypothetical protein